MAKAGYINGSFLTGEGDALVAENPSDGGVMARFSGLSVDQFGSAISAARQAFDRRRLEPLIDAGQAKMLHRLVDVLKASSESITATVAEIGCRRSRVPCGRSSPRPCGRRARSSTTYRPARGGGETVAAWS